MKKINHYIVKGGMIYRCQSSTPMILIGLSLYHHHLLLYNRKFETFYTRPKTVLPM